MSRDDPTGPAVLCWDGSDGARRAIRHAAAEEHDAPLIVMGQRRRSAFGTLVLGSVARELPGAAHRPVLLVGPDDTDG